MQFQSYKEINATPESEAKFLSQVLEGFAATDKPGERLYEFMQRTIEVDGKPFSQASHLTKLENDSYDWELEDTPVEVQKALVESAEALHRVDRGYDVPHFITGFEMVVQELKKAGVVVDHEAKLAKPRLENNVEAGFDPI